MMHDVMLGLFIFSIVGCLGVVAALFWSSCRPFPRTDTLNGKYVYLPIAIAFGGFSVFPGVNTIMLIAFLLWLAW